jgi:hypothetical protein
MQPRPSIQRTLLAGIAGGIAFLLGMFITFAQLSGSQRGDEGLLFDPDSQHPKVIAVWKQIEPLPRVIETPAIILVGMVAFGIAYAFLYRSVGPAWPAGIHARAWRLALVVWLATVFSEFMGPFNVLHQPLSLSVVAWGFWAVSAVAEAYTLVFILDRGRSRSERISQQGSPLATPQQLQ